MNYGNSRGFLFTILQKLVTEILQMGGPAFVKILLYLWKYSYFMRCQDLIIDN